MKPRLVLRARRARLAARVGRPVVVLGLCVAAGLGISAGVWQATHLDARPSATTQPTNTESGYWTVATDGGIFSFGNAPFFGSMGGKPLNQPIVGMAAAPTGGGYWLVASDGGIFSFGSAQFYGSMGTKHLNSPVVGMAASPTGSGYWLVAADGGIFSFGSARFRGSMGTKHLNSPVVGMAATPTGGGYWLVAADGGIFSFGNAHFDGSMGTRHLNEPIVGMAATPTGNGYWLVASDGGIFTFGKTQFLGSMGTRHLDEPVVGMAATYTGNGYWLVASDGGIFTFGTAVFHGSMGGLALNRPMVGIAARPVRPRPFHIAGNATTLNPGTSQRIDLVLTNPNRLPLTLTSSVAVTVTESNVGCPVAGNFTVTQGLTAGVTVPARSTESLSELGVPEVDWPVVTMLNTDQNQDACEGATLVFHYSAQATEPRGP